jgi:TRAP-type C4-dicarboxylate transport system permease small subunit
MGGTLMEPEAEKVWTRVFDKVLDLTVWIPGAIIVLIMLMTVYEVVSRKLFGAPTSWALDLSTLGLLVSSLLPTAFVLKRKGHVSVELVSAKLSSKSRSLLNIITYSLALLGCIAVALVGIEVTLTAYHEKEMLFRSLIIPKFWYLWVFSFSFCLVIIQLVVEIAHSCREYKVAGKAVDES